MIFCSKHIQIGSLDSSFSSCAQALLTEASQCQVPHFSIYSKSFLSRWRCQSRRPNRFEEQWPFLPEGNNLWHFTCNARTLSLQVSVVISNEESVKEQTLLHENASVCYTCTFLHYVLFTTACYSVIAWGNGHFCLKIKWTTKHMTLSSRIYQHFDWVADQIHFMFSK